MLPASFGVRNGVVGFDIVAFDLFHDFVGTANLLVFDIKNGINEVLALEQAKSVLPAKAREDGAVIEGSLAVEIEFGRPPSGRPILKLASEGMKGIASSLRAER